MQKLVEKYTNLPIQVKASMWFFLCAFLQKGISFITTPIFTRLLSTSEYGQYNVYTSWMSVLIVIVTLNLYCGVYSRGLVKFEDERSSFTSALQGLTITLVLIWTAIYLIFHKFWNNLFDLTTVQMLLMLLTMWTTVVFSFWSMEQRVDYKYRKLVVVTLLVSIAKPVVGIIFVSCAKDKVTARIFGIALVELICYSGFFFEQMHRGKTFFCKKFWKHALAFNIPLIPHYLSISVLNSADRIMIKSMVGGAQAGIYSLAYSVSMIMTMVNTALMQTIESWMYKKIKSKQISDISKVAYPAFVVVAGVNILLIAFAPEAIAIFAPTEYYDAIYVIPPVAMSVFFMFSYNFFAVFEFYYEKTKLIAFATSAGAILNVALNYVFIKMFGYYAAGYTTLLCFIIYAVFHFTFMRRICRKELEGVQPYNMRIYLMITLTFMTLGFLFLFSYQYKVLRYVLIIIIFGVTLLKKKRIMEMLKRFISIKKRVE